MQDQIKYETGRKGMQDKWNKITSEHIWVTKHFRNNLGEKKKKVKRSLKLTNNCSKPAIDKGLVLSAGFVPKGSMFIMWKLEEG